MSNKSNEFSKDTIDKYSNYLITSQRYQTPPFEWSRGIFQRFQPISGNFKMGNNFFGDMECVNNQSGRGFYANPCGYWDNSNNQFNSGKIMSNKPEFNMNGTLFPVNDINSTNVMSNPNDRVVFGYARIGEEYRSR